ncbi:RDD family protein [Streptomyces sp. NPDC001709]
MSSEPPPGSGEQPPEDDPFRKRPPSDQGAGSPYGTPYGGAQRPPPPGGYPGDPLAGMPPLADSGRRTLARIVDMILVGIVVWLLTWAFGVRGYQVDGDHVEVGKSVGQSFIAAVLYIAYDTSMMSKYGQTLGKKWLSMRVANLDNGATPSVRTNLVRSLVLWAPFAFCCAFVWTAICGGWSYFDKPYKHGLHDKAAKTVVVSTG